MINFNLIIRDKDFNVFLSKKARKNINIRIKPDNEIYISKPRNVSKKYIKRYLKDNSEWIIEKSDNINKVHQKRNSYFGKENIVIFDKKHSLKSLDIDIDLDGYLNNLIMAHINSTRADLDKVLKSYNIALPIIEIKKLKGKWGKCYVKKSVIQINQRLIHYPKFCLDYVLLHEYMHFIEANHSRQFYDLIKFYMPNYNKAVKYLKNN